MDIKGLLKSGLLFIFILSALNLSAQQQSGSTTNRITISGKVVSESNEPLIGVSVSIKNSQIGDITSVDGDFSLSGIFSQSDVLIVSYIGMQTQEVVLNGRTNFSITLTADNQAIDEVVVVGYGTQRKHDVTGAVASIKSEDLRAVPQTTITQALQGKIAGVQISNTSSTAEGETNTIRVRGTNSISAGSSPLIVLDGIIYSGFMSEISPNDIESIDVLKDASSAAIYGARAANGVILITSKKGSAGVTRINYDGYYGVDCIANLPDMMNAEEFYNFKLERKGVGGMTLSELVEYEDGTDTDWIGLATQNGKRQQHNISVSGGNEDTRYLISGSLGDVSGVAINDNYNRYTLRANIDSKVKSWLTIGSNTQLGLYDRAGSKADIYDAFLMNPLNVPYNEDGSINFEPWDGDTSITNPLESLNYISEDVSRSVLTNNYIQIDFPFLEGLSYKLNTGYYYRFRLIESYKGTDTLAGSQLGGWSGVYNQGKEDWSVENIVNYNKKFGLHTIGVTALYSAEQFTQKFHNVEASGFEGDYMTYFQNELAEITTASDSYSRTAAISQMLRINYNYDSRYMITATARRDGYSAFGDNCKFGIFPSLALGWNIEEESFMQDARNLDRLKLRLSYGKNGNQAISAYSSLPTMSNQNYLTNDDQTAIGYYANKLADPTLSWETTNSFNAGLDYSLFDGRITGTIDGYISRTSDLLLWKAIPEINGVESIQQNIGATANRGIEFQISTINVKSKNFTWTTNFNIAHSRNEILDIGSYDDDGNPVDNVGNKWFIGEQISVVYGYKFDGIWQEGDDIANSHMPDAQAGDVKIADTDGNGSIDADDKVILGSSTPDFTAGLTNTLSYKNLTLSFFLNFVHGVTRYTEYTNTYFDGRYNTITKEWWTEENPINTYPENRDDSNPYGVTYFGDGRNDASYVRLSDVTLSYKFPHQLLRKCKIDNLEVYVNAKNLATFTSYVGLDPELTSDYSTPLTKSFIFGVRFGL